MKRRHPESEAQRAFTCDDLRIEIIPETGCWLWMRALNAQRRRRAIATSET